MPDSFKEKSVSRGKLGHRSPHPATSRWSAPNKRLGFEIVKANVSQQLSEDELSIVGDIDATICGDRWTARAMDAAPKLKAICNGARAPTPSTSTPPTNAASRPQRARRLQRARGRLDDVLHPQRAAHPRLDKEIKAGRWTPLDGTSLAECTLGVIGMGNIGTVLRQARAFGMKLLGCDTQGPPQAP